MPVTITSTSIAGNQISASAIASAQPTWKLKCFNGATLLEVRDPTGTSGTYDAAFTAHPAATSHTVQATVAPDADEKGVPFP